MADLSTVYMGLKLKSPVILGSCSLSKHLDNIKEAEDAGAGALVVKSLFEEQLQFESEKLQAELEHYDEMIAESVTFHPDMEHGGASEHVMWLEKTCRAVDMPIIASVNAVSPGKWSDYAVQLEKAGVQALELNLYGVVTDARVDGNQVLKAMVETFRDVKSKVKIPVAAKLSPYFASPAHAAKALDDAGADALVLFNRFAHPDIDIGEERIRHDMVFSSPEEMGHPLRWTGILFDQINADICGSTGIHDANSIVKMLLAGANAVQVVSAVMKNGIDYIEALNQGVAEWMEAKNYSSIADFQGKISRAQQEDVYAFERAQYIKVLLGFD